MTVHVKSAPMGLKQQHVLLLLLFERKTAARIMFECPFAKVFWDLIKVQTNDITTAADIHKLAGLSHIPAMLFCPPLLLATMEEKE
jgi:hypothetical protein